MGLFSTIIITLLVINVLVLAHEGGHYWAARRVGVPVTEFSIGFGWRLLAFYRQGTVYSLRLIPLGGYVLLDLPEAADSAHPLAGDYTAGEKIGVALGGPLMNLFVALLIFVAIYSGIGIPRYSTEPVIGQVIKEMPAQQAGIRSGDMVLSVNSHSVKDWAGLTRQLNSLTAGEECSLQLKRNGKLISCLVATSRDEASGQTIIGVRPQVDYQKQGVPAGLVIGLKQTYQLSYAILSGLGGLATGALSADSMSGPIGLAGMVGDNLAYGWLQLLGFTALLSINLGIFNLLPIPFLDGGRIILALVEIVRRRALNPEKEAMLHWVGLAFLMVLMLYASYNDIVRLL